jgi:branched-chain amino acid transport system substrate-binding protein
MTNRFHRRLSLCAALVGGLMATTWAHAEIVIGASFTQTGPASALGIAPRNTMQLFPEEIAGEKIRVIVLDDATDPASASRNARRLVVENKVDVIIGSTATPTSIAIAAVALDTGTVQLAASPMEVPEGKDAWSFRLPQSVVLMAEGTIEHMKRSGVKTFGFLGYGDSYGENWLRDLTRYAQAAGIKLVATERFARTDSSVTAQALKIVGEKPDAVLVVASGSGALMPQKALVDRGYTGRVYQTFSAIAPDLIRMGGKDVEGTLGLSGPGGFPSQLPDGHPSKNVAQDFVKLYEARFGAGTYNQFAANIWCAKLLLEKAVPLALKKAKPGTPEFRLALREALETMGETAVPQGVLRYTPNDHYGYDARARAVLQVKDGAWVAVK